VQLPFRFPRHWPYACLGVGFVGVNVSFLFFARHMDVYAGLSMGGVLLALVGFVAIVVSRRSWKAKSACFAVMVAAVVAQQFSEGALIRTSYRIYLHEHGPELAELAGRLGTRRGSVRISPTSVEARHVPFDPTEKAALQELRKKTAAAYVFKDDEDGSQDGGCVYFEVWGALSVRHGVIYCPGPTTPTKGDGRLGEHWWYTSRWW
jgi:hypothetical protein